jgi:uncharacterized membrane protein
LLLCCWCLEQFRWKVVVGGLVSLNFFRWFSTFGGCVLGNGFGVWRQVLSLGVKAVGLESGIYPVKRTPTSGLRQVDFVVDGEDIRGLEQNPDTKSRWAAMARSGKKVMQFLSRGRYVANVVDGKVTLYTGRTAE